MQSIPFKKLIYIIVFSLFYSGCGFVKAKEVMINGQKKCELAADNISLLKVIEEIQTKAGFRISIDESIDESQPIKTIIRKDNWEEVLRRLCTKNGFRLRKDLNRPVFKITK